MVKELNKFKLMKDKQEKSFKTTLDFEVQKFTNQLLTDKAAAVCVMDVYNGDIVSLVSSPTFEPNEFVHGLDRKVLEQFN